MSEQEYQYCEQYCEIHDFEFPSGEYCWLCLMEEVSEYDEYPMDAPFYDPGGRSALRAGVREYPCPTCGKPNRLTAEDVKRHYQCDQCADMQERGY